MSTTTATIPLGQLSHCAANTRKTKASPGELAELVASITAHGLLENLVVSPTGNDIYEVVAGARRFDALHVLAKAGDVPADLGVPCTVIENGADVSEISLAENTVRVAMHPADQVEAFCRLHEQGSTVEEIANRFGITESLVTKRIRLGGVAPALLKAYREGKMDLSALMAFTVTDDRKRQVALYKQLDQGGRVSAWAVKRTLTEAKVSANTKIAHYVGLAAYEKAGGTVTRDLFADDHEQGVYLDDPALVERLAAEKLEKTAAKLRKQWKWADVVLENIYEVTHGYDRLFAGRGEATAKERERLDEIETESAPLIVNEENPGPLSETDAARLADLQTEYQKISDVIARREVWSPEQLAVAGCVVTIGHDGKGEVTKGFVKPEDRAAARKTEGRSRISDNSRSANPAADARKEAGISQAVSDDLAAIRTTLVKVELLNNPEVAQDLLTFGLARDLLFGGRYLGEDALEVRATASALRPTSRMADKAFVKSSPGEPVLVTEGKRLRKKFEWIKVAKEAQVIAAFQKFRKQKPETKAAVLAYCVALTVKNQLALTVQPDGAPALEAAIAEMTPGFKLARPSKEVLWNRVSKGTMLGILTATVDEAYAATLGAVKKGELAEHMERLFANPSADEFGLTAKAQERVLDWTPIGFQR